MIHPYKSLLNHCNRGFRSIHSHGNSKRYARKPPPPVDARPGISPPTTQARLLVVRAALDLGDRHGVGADASPRAVGSVAFGLLDGCQQYRVSGCVPL